MDTALNKVANTVRSWMRWPAVALNSMSGGRIKPDHVTLVSLLGHGAVVWALWSLHPVMAALFLAFFGIMDTLDGALARLQKTTSLRGMLYDAVSDRVKEVSVYIGLILFIERGGLYVSMSHVGAFDFYATANPSTWPVVAVCGMSLVVSYIKAKGEMALMPTGKYDAQKLNRLFSDGFARYEVRMVLIILGLLTGTIVIILYVLLVLLVFTALQRMSRVSKALTNV